MMRMIQELAMDMRDDDSLLMERTEECNQLRKELAEWRARYYKLSGEYMNLADEYITLGCELEAIEFMAETEEFKEWLVLRAAQEDKH